MNFASRSVQEEQEQNSRNLVPTLLATSVGSLSFDQKTDQVGWLVGATQNRVTLAERKDAPEHLVKELTARKRLRLRTGKVLSACLECSLGQTACQCKHVCIFKGFPSPSVFCFLIL